MMWVGCCISLVNRKVQTKTIRYFSFISTWLIKYKWWYQVLKNINVIRISYPLLLVVYEPVKYLRKIFEHYLPKFNISHPLSTVPHLHLLMETWICTTGGAHKNVQRAKVWKIRSWKQHRYLQRASPETFWWINGYIHTLWYLSSFVRLVTHVGES